MFILLNLLLYEHNYNKKCAPAVAVFANTWLFTTVHLRERSRRYAQPKYNNCLSYRRPYIVPSARAITEVCAAEVYKLSEL